MIPERGQEAREFEFLGYPKSQKHPKFNGLEFYFPISSLQKNAIMDQIMEVYPPFSDKAIWCDLCFSKGIDD